MNKIEWLGLIVVCGVIAGGMLWLMWLMTRKPKPVMLSASWRNPTQTREGL